NIAAIDALSGLATSWNPDAIYDVHSLALSGNLLYVGGDFYIIGGEFRSRLAALDLQTGTATSWNPGVYSSYPTVYAIAVSDGTVSAGGAFEKVGPASRSCIAAVDAATGLATSWNPDPDDVVLALAAGGGRVYAGGQFAIMGGQPCGGLASIAAS